MEPARPNTTPDAQGASGLPDTQRPSGGPLSRVKSGLTSYFGVGLSSPDAGSQAAGSLSSALGEPTPEPGLQPKVDTTPAAPASPWANPDAATAAAPTAGVVPDAAAGTPAFSSELQGADHVDTKDWSTGDKAQTNFATTGSIILQHPKEPGSEGSAFERAMKTTPFTSGQVTSSEVAGTEPIAAVTPEPVAPPDPLTVATEPTPDPAVTDTTPAEPTAEPIVDATATQPEPVAVSPVWTPDVTQPEDGTTTARGASAIDPDMRPSSAPSVEPTATAALPEDTTTTLAETPEEPPLFTKTVDGDLIKYVLTPEGRAKIQGAFTSAIEDGTFDNLFGPLMDRPEATQKDTLASATANTQGAPEPAPLNPTPIDTSANSTVIPTAPAPAAVDWSNPGGPGPTSS